MKSKEDIIRRAEIVLCISDRCSLERNVDYKLVKHGYRERETQRLTILKWLKQSNFYEYMEDTDKMLFDHKVGHIFTDNMFIQNKFQHEAIEPLLWSLGLISKMTSYSEYSLADRHKLMCVHIPHTMDEMIKKTILKSEENIEFRRKIAMLWHWRAVEGKNQIFKDEPIKDILLDIFGNKYIKAINYILKNQKNKQDFCLCDKPVYELDITTIQHLYKRTLWRYHAFEWIVSEEKWYDVSTDT